MAIISSIALSGFLFCLYQFSFILFHPSLSPFIDLISPLSSDNPSRCLSLFVFLYISNPLVPSIPLHLPSFISYPL